MPGLATCSKIKKFIEEKLIDQLSAFTDLLLAGDLSTFEKSLAEAMSRTYNLICEELLVEASHQLQEELTEQASALGGRQIEIRPLKFRVATGQEIKVASPYVKRAGKTWSGTRHLLAKHWSIIGKASPGLYDRVGFCAVLSQSYELACEALNKFGVAISLSSVRKLTNRLADHCYEFGEEHLMLEAGESLAGKRVVISIDGGRTRTRHYDGGCNQAGNWTYQTEWCEPKLFVIDVLDDQGQPHRKELPVYGCRFTDVDVLEVLRRYLKALQIDQAEQVQILADGAPWIWNSMKALLLSLHVEEDRIIQTLDYYHASQYVHSLVDQMPRRIAQQQREVYLKQFKDWLWQGNAGAIVEQCRQIYKRPGQLIKRWMNYLDKHQDKTQYAVYEESKLMCGSGIIESAIRRIINLRFKNASTFWEKERVEKLYFLRAALLSKRWSTVMKNLSG